MESKKKRVLAIFTLGLLSAIGPFSIDMYLPGFPDMAASLNTSISRVTLSISSFFIGISVGQLIYGPLLDRFGRKIPLYIGLIIYFASSIYCVFVNDVDSLIAVRFVQALGSCSGMVAARALVRDLFPVNENAKVFSLLMLVIAVSPIIAPTLGGHITAAFGWHGIFILLAAISLLTLLAVMFWLPDGRSGDPELSLKPGPISKGFIAVARVPKFFTYALAGALASSGLYSYIAGSPYVFMELYHVTDKQYGWIFGTIAMGLVLASQMNTLLLRKFTSEKITVVALVCQVITGLALVILTSFHWINMYSMIALIWVYLATQGLIFPNTSALALSPFSKNAGAASALMGAVQLGIGALATVMVSALSNQTALPMVGVMGLCASSALVVLLIGRRFVKDEPTEDIQANSGVFTTRVAEVSDHAEV